MSLPEGFKAQRDGLTVIPNNAQVQQINYQPNGFSPPCSIGMKPFDAMIDIAYDPDEWLLEYISFEDVLRKRCMNKPTTIEELARSIFDLMERALGDIPIAVTVSGRTTVHGPVSAHIANQKWRDRHA